MKKLSSMILLLSVGCGTNSSPDSFLSSKYSSTQPTSGEYIYLKTMFVEQELLPSVDSMAHPAMGGSQAISTFRQAIEDEAVQELSYADGVWSRGYSEAVFHAHNLFGDGDRIDRQQVSRESVSLKTRLPRKVFKKYSNALEEIRDRDLPALANLRDSFLDLVRTKGGDWQIPKNKARALKKLDQLEQGYNDLNKKSTEIVSWLKAMITNESSLDIDRSFKVDYRQKDGMWNVHGQKVSNPEYAEKQYNFLHYFEMKPFYKSADDLFLEDGSILLVNSYDENSDLINLPGHHKEIKLKPAFHESGISSDVRIEIEFEFLSDDDRYRAKSVKNPRLSVTVASAFADQSSCDVKLRKDETGYQAGLGNQQSIRKRKGTLILTAKPNQDTLCALKNFPKVEMKQAGIADKVLSSITISGDAVVVSAVRINSEI